VSGRADIGRADVVEEFAPFVQELDRAARAEMGGGESSSAPPIGGGEVSREAEEVSPETSSGPERRMREVTAEELRPFLVTCGKIAGRMWSVDPLTDDEADMLSETAAPVLNKWVPDLAAEYQEEAALIMVLLLISLPRVAQYQEARALQEAEETEALRQGPEPEEYTAETLEGEA